MVQKNDLSETENRIKTFRWLFFLSVFQLLVCLTIPVLIFPKQVLFAIESFVALTVGLLFALYLLGVSIYGFFVDRSRRPVYVGVIIFMSAWTLWTIITWRYIEHMGYLT